MSRARQALRSFRLVVACVGLADASAQPASQPIDRAAWLAGCWAADAAEPGSVEQWLAPAGGAMLGMNRTVRAGRMTQFEFMAIRAVADGSLVFTALPGGRNETDFALRSSSADELVFESPRQAFPNRVIYRRTGERTMLGRIEGTTAGAARAVDFPFARVACSDRP